MKTKKAKQFLSIELSEEQTERFLEVLERAKRRNKLSTRSHVIRELLGLTHYELLTEADKAYFRGDFEIAFPVGPDTIDVSEPLMDRGDLGSQQPVSDAQKRDVEKIKTTAVEHARGRRKNRSAQ